MLLFGNLCVCLAAFIYLLPWLILLGDGGRGHGAGAGMLWGSVILVLPLGLLLTCAWLAVAARGGMQWLPLDRAMQYVVIVVAGLAITTVVGLSAALRLEPATQMPWAIRPLVPIAAWILPPLLIASAGVALNAGSDAFAVPAARATWALAAGISVLVGLGLLVELMQSQVARGEARLREEIAFQDRRDARIRAEVGKMTLAKDFRALLNFSNIHEKEDIRQLALGKLRAHPDLTTAVRDELVAGAAYEAIIYLQGNDPPRPELLADAIGTGIERIAVGLADSIAATHTLYAEQGEAEVMRILDVVARYRKYGVDYRPALQRLRRALDDSRPGQPQLRARARLDRADLGPA